MTLTRREIAFTLLCPVFLAAVIITTGMSLQLFWGIVMGIGVLVSLPVISSYLFGWPWSPGVRAAKPSEGQAGTAEVEDRVRLPGAA